MNKRVYGVIGIASIMANWNADFSGYPKTTSDGKTFGSDKALKYPMKKMWDDRGEKVLYIKSMKFSGEKEGESALIPRSLKERYEHVFDVKDLKNCKDSKEILRNLMSAIDVKNFGATFAEEKNNFSITGAVQIGQGFNKYDGTEPQEQPILSPFRDPKLKQSKEDKEGKEEARNSTLGTKIVSNEAHYFYPFVINPMAYRELKELGVTDGYTEEDYLKFKEAALVSATAFATNSKAGCENEFALFVETKPDAYLPGLCEYISFIKAGEDGRKNHIRIDNGWYEDYKDGIDRIEIYYNPHTTELDSAIEGAVIYNILSQKEV